VPADALENVKRQADLVLQKPGGFGAVARDLRNFNQKNTMVPFRKSLNKKNN
jgi:3-deoxy-D-manno-octulosonate 8-phosphate phosphatase KdsC-like HAD superfamily phosphatase